VSRLRRLRLRLWGQQQGDERGATLVLTGLCMILLLWGGAMGVDLGFTVYGSRQAQAMADTAALDLSRYINIADNIDVGNNQQNNAAAVTYLDSKLANVATDNTSNAGLTMTLGLWKSGSFTPESKCTPASPPLTYTCNAVDVTANQSVPQIFFGGFRVLSGHAGSTATADRSTIAAVTPEASFSIGTYLASLTDPGQQLPVLNALLGTLGSASLTAVGYQGLADTDVTINQMVTASGGLLTTSNVLTTSLSAQEWLTIWTDAVSNRVAQLNCGASPVPSPCEAGTGLTEITGGGDMATLCQFMSVNMGSIASGCTNTTTTTTILPTSALSANLNLLQLLTTEAEFANGSSALNVTSALGITGVTTAQLYLTLVKPPQVAYGVVNTTASTAQVQADLQLTLPALGLLDIPLSAASGTATLKTLKCQNNSMSSTTIAGATTTASGNVTLAGTNIATVSITGYSGPSSTFAAGVVPPTASTASATPAPTNPVQVAPPSPAPTVTGLSGSTNPIVSTALSTVTGLLDPVLQAAGVSVGGASIADLGTSCDAVSLVQ
jgi:uncharacterized membrane protein